MPQYAAPTPSQTIGPFFHFALLDKDLTQLVAPDHPSGIRVKGKILDGAGEVVPDAMVEIFQADPAGRYPHPGDDGDGRPPDGGFSGFGRCGTDEYGEFSFVTVKPGPILGPNSDPQAPHVLVSVFARGLLKRLVTRLYFPDEERANAFDPVLNRIEDPNHRSTLLAYSEDDGLRFDIHLQGENQTVFFDV